ncbi:MAG: hypothetical protein A2Y41_10570 [Spirochaetes bacterium GWB1_36_13]|nr:MAG: hypothetical protein A2Y41_10570 [Spirochaetes bacterium GWB1_36_13]
MRTLFSSLSVSSNFKGGKIMDVIIAGIGGQGTILASNILSLVMVKKGYDVKKSEIHGMSQRGGSVISHIRFSENKIASPTVRLKSADILLSFHPNETRRYKHLLKENGKIIQLTDEDKAKLPNPRSLNIFGLGKLSSLFQIEQEMWAESLKELIKPSILDINLKAFEIGLKEARS